MKQPFLLLANQVTNTVHDVQIDQQTNYNFKLQTINKPV